MRKVRHFFHTIGEAIAFADGVTWVNDSAIQVDSIEVDKASRATVVCTDEDGDEDLDIDHRTSRVAGEEA